MLTGYASLKPGVTLAQANVDRVTEAVESVGGRVESGTEQGLKVLNKQMSVEQNLAALRTLKELELNVSYGFMLFDPSSTIESIRENLAF